MAAVTDRMNATDYGQQRAGTVTRSAYCQIIRPTDTTQYAANDSISDSTGATPTLPTITVASEPGHAGIIHACSLIKSTNVTTAASFSVHLFTATLAAANLSDNAAIGITDAESLTYVGGWAFVSTDGIAFANNSVWCKSNLDLPFVCAATDTKLYVVLRSDSTYTPGNAEHFDLLFDIVYPS